MSTGIASKPEIKNDTESYNADSTKNDEDSKVSLPSINIVLEKIEHYQNQQKLSDSQLLLELTQRQPSSNSPVPQNEDLQTSDPSRNSTPSYQQYPYQSSSGTHSNFQPSKNDAMFRSENSSSSSLATASQFGKRLSRSNSTSNNASNNTKPVQLTPKTNQLETLSRTSSVDSLDSSMKSGSNTPTSSIVSLDGGFGNKKRTNLPRETIEILNDWILNNMDNPYPSHSQKRLLLERTGLSNVQLSNWFINKRRRRIFSKLSGNNGQPIKKKRLIDRI